VKLQAPEALGVSYDVKQPLLLGTPYAIGRRFNALRFDTDVLRVSQCSRWLSDSALIRIATGISKRINFFGKFSFKKKYCNSTY
jgi:hypothetical protein